MSYVDLFGNVVEENLILTEKYIEPPFSVLDGRSQRWQERKRIWKNLGIKSEVGREAVTYHLEDWANNNTRNKLPSDTSIFDPVVCELMYKWFCAENGCILDPFAGGG